MAPCSHKLTITGQPDRLKVESTEPRGYRRQKGTAQTSNPFFANANRPKRYYARLENRGLPSGNYRLFTRFACLASFHLFPLHLFQWPDPEDEDRRSSQCDRRRYRERNREQSRPSD